MGAFGKSARSTLDCFAGDTVANGFLSTASAGKSIGMNVEVYTCRF
jgi:hypothetical protein